MPPLRCGMTTKKQATASEKENGVIGSALAAQGHAHESDCACANEEDAGWFGDRLGDGSGDGGEGEGGGGGEVDGFIPFIQIAIVKNDGAQAIHMQRAGKEAACN